MPSVVELYNQEVLEGHREALAALRELLVEETNPAERRKLANAILRTRPVKNAKANHAETLGCTHPDTTVVPNQTSTITKDRNRKPNPIAPVQTHSTTTDHDHNRELHELHTLMLNCAAMKVPQECPNNTDQPAAYDPQAYPPRQSVPTDDALHKPHPPTGEQLKYSKQG
ncbi:MAG: hypothetical protein QM783_06560 [Phycisphaerales bacterium]